MLLVEGGDVDYTKKQVLTFGGFSEITISL